MRENCGGAAVLQVSEGDDDYADGNGVSYGVLIPNKKQLTRHDGQC